MQQKTDLNTIIGLLLIFVLFFVWSKFFAPKPPVKPEPQASTDTIEVRPADVDTTTIPRRQANASLDAGGDATANEHYGLLAPALTGEDKEVSLENDLMRVTFSSKGGQIKKVFLKHHVKTVLLDKKRRKKAKEPVTLWDNPGNRFEYHFKLDGASDSINTARLYFTPHLSGNVLTLTAQGADGAAFQQVYTIRDGSYALDYEIKLPGLASRVEGPIVLRTENYLNKLELPSPYGEKMYATAYYKPVDDDYEKLSPSKVNEEKSEGPVKWVSDANQFFNSTLIARTSFERASVELTPLKDSDKAIKLIRKELQIPVGERFAMTFYNGPNEFERLRQFHVDLEMVIPFGRSIFGAINRWVIRPLFDFLSGLTGQVGLSIVLLTLIVKLAVYPLTLKSLKSQAKMRALKPELDALKKKYGDDQQAYSAATMKLYQEYGVNPMGGCLPMLLQMPIWFALYRFFPGAINFRQQRFLWADDLSTYDDVIHFGHKIPVFGDHISLFTLLWVISILVYTWYNSKQIDMSQANPSMKYIQYIMPLMFLFVLNSYASGLTAYMLVSNSLNIAQTFITKKFVIDDEKVRAAVLKNKERTKKGRFATFQERLAKAIEEQQRLQEQQKKGKRK